MHVSATLLLWAGWFKCICLMPLHFSRDRVIHSTIQLAKRGSIFVRRRTSKGGDMPVLLNGVRGDVTKAKSRACVIL
jgi:hypothetical protein